MSTRDLLHSGFVATTNPIAPVARTEDAAEAIHAVIVVEEQLHIYSADGEEWVIAKSPEDARDVYCYHIGTAPNDGEDDPRNDYGTHASHWEALPDDHVFKMVEECDEKHGHGGVCPMGCDEHYHIHLSMTASEWCKERGRGYLASANW